MVSKPFKGYALAPNRRGTVFLVRGADKNSRIVFQRASPRESIDDELSGPLAIRKNS